MSVAETLGYRSPLSKLLRFFHRSRDQQFSLGVVAGSLALVLCTGTRLQRVADVLAMRKAGLKVRRVEEKLGWLRKYAPQVRRWREMLSLIGAVEHYVRHEGIHAKAAEDLAAMLPKSTIPAVSRLRKQLLEFVAAQSQQARQNERLLGSSEVLESIIGKFKHLAGERGQHGLTGMVLSVGALVGHLSVATVEAAMTDTTTTEVWNWCRSHLGATVQSVRQRIKQALHPEQNQKTLRLKSS